MLIDQPFKYSDFFDYYDNIKAIFSPLEDAITNIESLVQCSSGFMIGIKGEWGTGKTSLLKGLEEYFHHYRGCPTLFFEAWRYKEEESPLIPLLLRLRGLTKGETKERLTSFIKVLKVSGMILSDVFLKQITGKCLPEKVGIEDIKKYFEDIEGGRIEIHSKYEENMKSLSELVGEIAKEKIEVDEKIKEKWENFIKEKAKLPIQNEFKPFLIIFVDDLDRLLPDDALRILEMLRFYFSVPGCMVIMGINDKILSSYINNIYNLQNTKDMQNSGDKYIEKVFEWSMELPHLNFSDVIQEIHFRDVNKKVKIQWFNKSIKNIISSVDPLPHRKWIRIANRLEMKISENQIPKVSDLWGAIFEECFPKGEQFLREFPYIKEKIYDDFEKFSSSYEDLASQLERIITDDKTNFRFPQKNFILLIEAQKKIEETV